MARLKFSIKSLQRRNGREGEDALPAAARIHAEPSPAAAHGPATNGDSLPERLWNRAYDDLKADESSLVQAYEQILSHKLGEIEQGGNHSIAQDQAMRRAQMRQLLEAGLKKTEREAKVQQGIGNAMQVVQSAKGIIESAIQAVPQAALAWAGVCIALEILANPGKATKANRDGVIHVATRMNWYWNMADMLLKENSSDGLSHGLRHELENRVVKLYQALLSYQMMSICSYYRRRGLEFLRGMLRLDDWDGSLKKVHEAEDAVRQDSAAYNMQQMLSHLERMAIAQEKKLLASPDSHRITSPTSHWIVPFGRNRDFVGREAVLRQLLERIPPRKDKDDCQFTAIEGLGGVGKTQIALEAAFRIREEQPDCSVFWVPAVDTASFENGFREIGRQLSVKGIEDDKADIKLLVKEALSQDGIGNWLLIIDNADDIELLFSSTAGGASLLEYLPFHLNGSILLTTRNHEVVTKLDIPRQGVISPAELSMTEAIEMLEKNLDESQRGTPSTTRLLEFLANLPLAIKQASAYMAKTGMSTSEYLGFCQSSDKGLIALLSKDFEDRGRYKTIQNPIATTWLISFEQVSRDHQLAASYLKFICFLAEKDIPISLLPEADDELERIEAIAILKAYAFITQRKGEDSFDMHRLVRLAMRNWLAGTEGKPATGVIQTLSQAFPFPQHENRAVCMRYLPHVQAALDSREASDDKMAESRLLFHIGEAFDVFGKFYEAEQMYRQALKLKEEILGREHPSIIGYINNLGCVLEGLGRYEESEEMQREVLKLAEKIYGPTHAITLSGMHNLASTLYNQRRLDEAERLQKRTVDLSQKIYDKEHPLLLSEMTTYAMILSDLGRYEEAEEMHRQTFELKRKVFGQDHPRTLISMNSLATTLNNLGRSEEAERIHRQVLELQEKVLGSDHPQIASTFSDLGAALYNQGRYREAEDMYRQAVMLGDKLLGTTHPDTQYYRARLIELENR